MTEHKVGTREEAQAAREELLKREKELTRRGDELARERRELPWVRVEKEYRFETDDGTKTLAELFDGRSQLLVYHFMFGPEYTGGLPVCSSAADTFDGAGSAPEGARRDIPLRVARAARPPAGLQAAHGLDVSVGVVAGKRLQLRLRRLAHRGAVGAVPGRRPPSCCCSDGDRVRDRPGGISVRGAGPERLRALGRRLHHTYSTYYRGLEIILGFYPLLDRTAKGRERG